MNDNAKKVLSGEESLEEYGKRVIPLLEDLTREDVQIIKDDIDDAFAAIFKVIDACESVDQVIALASEIGPYVNLLRHTLGKFNMMERKLYIKTGRLALENEIY